MGIKLLKYFCKKVIPIIAITALSNSALANHNIGPQSGATLRVEIALQITPFLTLPTTKKIINYCVYTGDDSWQAQNEISKIANGIKPEINLHHIKLSSDVFCDLLLINSDNKTNILRFSSDELYKKSVIISYGEFAIQYGADIAVIKNGNKFTLQIKASRLLTKKVIIKSQLLKIAKIIPD